MRKKLLFLGVAILSGLTAFAHDIPTSNQQPEFALEATLSGPTLTLKGNNVHVQNGQGEVLEVFSLTGTKIASTKVESNDQQFSFNLSRGIYIFKIGKVVRKVAIS